MMMATTMRARAIVDNFWVGSRRIFETWKTDKSTQIDWKVKMCRSVDGRRKIKLDREWSEAGLDTKLVKCRLEMGRSWTSFI